MIDARIDFPSGRKMRKVYEDDQLAQVFKDVERAFLHLVPLQVGEKLTVVIWRSHK